MPDKNPFGNPSKKPTITTSIRFIEHPLITSQSLEARIYQQTILASCVKENTLVVLPTGLGKTAIMVLITLHRLEQFPDGSVLILAPSKPLVEQHRDTFQRILTNPEMVYSLTGIIPPNKRKDIWKNAKIVIATPQIVQNDIISGIFHPEKCNFLAIDEAHRTRGNYAYVFVAETYLKRAKTPLISAFTASPGTSYEDIQNLCKILEIESIEARTEKDADVRPYVQPVNVELIQIKLSKEFKNIQNLLKECLSSKLKSLKDVGYSFSLGRLKRREILELQKTIQQKLARSDSQSSGTDPIPSDEPQHSEYQTDTSKDNQHRTQIEDQDISHLYAALGATSNIIRLLHGRELLETQGITAFSKYLLNLTQKHQTLALQNLTEPPTFQKMLYTAQNLADSNYIHPKFSYVEKIVKEQLTKNSDSRILIFSRFRVTLNLLSKSLQTLHMVRSKVFIGQQKRGQEKGMSQKEQYTTLKSFKEGKTNVLLATNIGEEGIDVVNCDLVIFYDAVSPIRTIQRRGRTGRQAPGRVVVLVTQGTQEEGLYWSSKRKEKEMHDNMKLIADYSKKIKNQRSHFTLDKFVPVSSQSATPSSTEIINQHISRSSSKTSTHHLSGTSSEQSRKEMGTIAVDQRETNSAVVKNLYELGFDVELRQLRVADYIIGELAIERKTSEDFIQSLIDGRLFRETKNMVTEYSKSVLILEGENPFISHRSIDPKALKGALASIIVDYGVPVLQTKNSKETAAMIAALARRVFRDKQSTPRITTGRSPITLSEIQTRIIATIPQINSVLAKRLLSKFMTPKNILLASKEDLKTVKGVGNNIADKIRETIDGEYTD